MRIFELYSLYVPMSLKSFIYGILVILFLLLLIFLLIRSKTLNIALGSVFIFMSFVRCFLVQLDLASFAFIVGGFSMLLISSISNLVGGGKQPGLFNYIGLFLIGCVISYLAPQLFALWFATILQHLSNEFTGVFELVAYELSPIGTKMNISDLLNPVSPDNNGGTSISGSGSRGSAGNGGAVVNGNTTNQVQTPSSSGRLNLPDSVFNIPFDPSIDNTSALAILRAALEQHSNNLLASGSTQRGSTHIRARDFTPVQEA